MSSGPTALIVDFGGVLTSDLWESLRGCARREGIPEETLVDLLRHDGEICPSFEALERGDIDQVTFEAACGRAAGVPPDGLLARMFADLRPDEAMLAELATLRGRGIRIGVLSNSSGIGDFSPYEGYDLASRADAVVISDRVRRRKPEPEIFHLMVRELGVTPSDCVFVDDTAGHLVAAAALGMRTVHHRVTRDTIAALRTEFAAVLPQDRCFGAE